MRSSFDKLGTTSSKFVSCPSLQLLALSLDGSKLSSSSSSFTSTIAVHCGSTGTLAISNPSSFTGHPNGSRAPSSNILTNCSGDTDNTNSILSPLTSVTILESHNLASSCVFGSDVSINSLNNTFDVSHDGSATPVILSIFRSSIIERKSSEDGFVICDISSSDEARRSSVLSCFVFAFLVTVRFAALLSTITTQAPIAVFRLSSSSSSEFSRQAEVLSTNSTAKESGVVVMDCSFCPG